MNFETVKKSNKPKIIIGVITLLIITSVVMFVSTRAKYKSVQNLKLANGVVDYKAPDLKVNILVSEDGTNYNSSNTIPEGNYTFNSEKSKCRIPTSTLTGENAPLAEGVTIEYTDNKINILGVTKKDTRCYVYFDKVLGQTSSSIIANIKARTDGSYKGSTTPTFTSVATGAETEANNGIFETDDPMYGTNAKTYYWRGAATTNHVIFDNKCWRIVRFNGDGSTRLIYNGTSTNNTCQGNGSNSDAVIMSTSDSEKYYATNDGKVDNSSYVGWTYTLDTQRTLEGTSSNAKKQIESWYIDNISTAAKQNVDSSGKFCNDRNTRENEEWRKNGETQFYAAYERLFEGIKTSTLSCSNGDIYKLSVGMITADEVQFAGASGGTTNKKYYLYNGQHYWTMSPNCWYSNLGHARVFAVRGDDGNLSSGWSVRDPAYLRPVINLRSNVTFNLGSDGTQNNPYIVID